MHVSQSKLHHQQYWLPLLQPAICPLSGCGPQSKANQQGLRATGPFISTKASLGFSQNIRMRDESGKVSHSSVGIARAMILGGPEATKAQMRAEAARTLLQKLTQIKSPTLGIGAHAPQRQGSENATTPCQLGGGVEPTFVSCRIGWSCP